MKWTTKAIGARGALLAAVLLAGCDMRDMYDQPKDTPLKKSEFFGDDRSARPLEPDTVARGELRTNEAFYAGTRNGTFVETIPLPVDEAFLRRGRQQYDIFCAPCHDRTGGGQGMIVQRGFQPPVSFHIERLRRAPAGYLYDVIARGFGPMQDYAAQLTPEDRWAIVAYIRALQLSQNATVADVPEAERTKLEAKQP